MTLRPQRSGLQGCCPCQFNIASQGKLYNCVLYKHFRLLTPLFTLVILSFQDLVLWASVGIHHIPHTEDLPVTPTVGGHLGIYLLPFNYFQESPSMASRDSVRLELKEKFNMASGVSVEGYKSESTCLPRLTDLDEEFGDNAEEVFA